jgi:hypothetical protein
MEYDQITGLFLNPFSILFAFWLASALTRRYFEGLNDEANRSVR